MTLRIRGRTPQQVRVVSSSRLSPPEPTLRLPLRKEIRGFVRSDRRPSVKLPFLSETAIGGRSAESREYQTARSLVPEAYALRRLGPGVDGPPSRTLLSCGKHCRCNNRFPAWNSSNSSTDPENADPQRSLRFPLLLRSPGRAYRGRGEPRLWWSVRNERP
jgi:hypothetical protein